MTEPNDRLAVVVGRQQRESATLKQPPIPKKALAALALAVRFF
jgi:hypothetical protein